MKLYETNRAGHGVELLHLADRLLNLSLVLQLILLDLKQTQTHGSNKHKVGSNKHKVGSNKHKVGSNLLFGLFSYLKYIYS